MHHTTRPLSVGYLVAGGTTGVGAGLGDGAGEGDGVADDGEGVVELLGVGTVSLQDAAGGTTAGSVRTQRTANSAISSPRQSTPMKTRRKCRRLFSCSCCANFLNRSW